MEKRPMIAKVHSNDGKLILALCDNDILGKTFEEGEKILDLSSSFYKGKEATEDIIMRLIKQAYIVNAVGNDVIAVIKKMGILDESTLITIADVPYIQIVNTNMEN